MRPWLEFVSENPPLPHIDLRTWGRSCWTFLNAVAFVYPKNPSNQQKEHMRSFLQALPFVLPCPRCGSHLEQEMRRTFHDQVLESQYHLMKWINELHNAVNRRKGKREITLEEMYRLCQTGYRTSAMLKYSASHVKTLIIVVFALITLYLLFYPRIR